jgi:hypothetical protein
VTANILPDYINEFIDDFEGKLKAAKLKNAAEAEEKKNNAAE